MTKRSAEPLHRRSTLRLIGMQQQLALCRVHDVRVEAGGQLLDAWRRRAAQRVVHLGNAALAQDEHGALHAQLVQLQSLEERCGAVVVAECGCHACAYGVLVSADNTADDFEPVAVQRDVTLRQSGEHSVLQRRLRVVEVREVRLGRVELQADAGQQPLQRVQRFDDLCGLARHVDVVEEAVQLHVRLRADLGQRVA